MYYVSTYPERVERLVLVDPAPPNSELLVRSYFELLGRLTPEQRDRLDALYESDAYSAGDPASHNEAMRISEVATFHVPEARDTYFDLISFDEESARNMVAISGPAKAMKLNITVEAQLADIACPTLIGHGEYDFIVEASPRLIQSLIAGSDLVVVCDSGHYPFIEQPQAFGRAISEFVDRQ